MIRTRAKSGQATQTTPPPPHGDSGGIAPPTVLPEKEPFTIPWFIDLTLRHTSRFAIYIRTAPVGLARRCTLVSTVILYTSIALVIAFVTRSQDGTSAANDIPWGKDGVALIGHSYKIDLIALTLTIRWDIVGCGTYLLRTYPSADTFYTAAGCDVSNRALDVYLNNPSEPVFSYDPANFPFVPSSLQDPSYTGSGRKYVNALNTFIVDHSLDFDDQAITPFDLYHFDAFMFIIDKATNTSAPIITFLAGEGPDNFAVLSVYTPTRSNYTYDSGMGPITVEVESAAVDIEVKRSRFAKAFTVCLAIINSALAIASAYITLLVFVRREKMNDSLLVLPVTVVLTIPTLRGLYAGSLPFGIFIDTFGFFLQMMIVAVCSVVLLYIATTSSAKAENAPQVDSSDEGRIFEGSGRHIGSGTIS